MCGIVGFTGNKDCLNILINGLKALEYRGYDSAGVAVQTGSGIEIRKTQGKVQKLVDNITERQISGTCGIGHTRWATHGEPTGINAHPHTDSSARLAIVHNGIIENYAELRTMLSEKGMEFISQTDTEVAAKLLGYLYDGDMLLALSRFTELLRGSYAIAVVSADEPDKIYCVCKDGPIVLGKTADGTFAASDISAMLSYTRDIYYLPSGVVAVLSKNELKFYDSLCNTVEIQSKRVSWNIEEAKKGEYEHFMLKEIHEQPAVIEKILDIYTKNNAIKQELFTMPKERAESLSRIRIISCGTAYHAGLVGKQYIERLAGIHVDVEVASEFRYGNAIIDKNEEVILISQSGETADTIAALKLVLAHGCHTTAICNVLGSSITRLANSVLYTHAGPEISVAATKTYTAQIAVLLLFAVDIAVKSGKISTANMSEIISELGGVAKIMKKQLDEKDKIQYLASRCVNIKNVFFIGRGLDYALSMEGALKLKEVSYLHSEAYAAGELKHGTIALIENGTLVIALATQTSILEKMASNMEETKVRGAYVVAISQAGWQGAKHCSQEVYEVPVDNPMLSPFSAVVPLQLIAYYFAVQRGRDVDKPRNLAKSVTVE